MHADLADFKKYCLFLYKSTLLVSKFTGLYKNLLPISIKALV